MYSRLIINMVLFILAGKLVASQEKISDSREWAMSVLTTSAQGTASAPAMRTYLLWQTGNALAGQDKKLGLETLHAAFQASLAIEDDPETKSFLQQQVLSLISRLDVVALEELLAQAEAGPRQVALDRLVRHYTRQKDFGRALESIRALSAEREFPYAAASELMSALPPNLAAERTSLFVLALTSYRSHEHKHSFATNDLGALTVRFWGSLPKDLVLEAVDELLRQAQADTAGNTVVRATMHSGQGTVSFASTHEYRLFQLLPVLRQLDPGRAAALLKQHAGARRALEQHPAGLDGLDKGYSSGAGDPGGITVTMRIEGKTADSGSQEDRYMVELGRETDLTVKRILAKPSQGRALLAALPDGSLLKTRSFRAEALLDATEQLADTERDAAADLLAGLGGSLQGLDAMVQVKYLARASSLALKLGDAEQAKSFIRQGMKAAKALLAADQMADDPNRSLKAFWPSAAAWRVFVALGARVSYTFAAELMEEAPDEEIRATLKVTLAGRLLGASETVNMVQRRHKANVMVDQMPIPQ